MLIVKVFPDAGEGWVRESAALAAAPAGAPVPRLVAASASPPVVVMTDAGTGPSVADALLGGDAAEAGMAVGRLAAALAALDCVSSDHHSPIVPRIGLLSGMILIKVAGMIPVSDGGGRSNGQRGTGPRPWRLVAMATAFAVVALADTRTMVASTLWAIATASVLQCVEEGRLLCKFLSGCTASNLTTRGFRKRVGNAREALVSSCGVAPNRTRQTCPATAVTSP